MYEDKLTHYLRIKDGCVMLDDFELKFVNGFTLSETAGEGAMVTLKIFVEEYELAKNLALKQL